MCQSTAFEGAAWSWKKWTEKHSDEEETVATEAASKGGRQRNKAWGGRRYV